MRGRCGLSLAIVGMAVAVGVQAQEVISARAGVIHFLEGSVFVDDQPLTSTPGTFPSIKEGSTLRTAKGRAEVLLTPNVFLRVDEFSAVRMLGTALTDTRVDFTRGAIIVDALKADASIPVVILYGQSQIRFPKPGVYRLDSDTNVIQAYSGEAEVTPPEGKATIVDSSHLYFFGLGTLTTKFTDGTEDEFYDWAQSRFNAIESENQLAQQTGNDAADLDNPPAAPDGIGAYPLPTPGTVPSYGYGVPGRNVWVGSVFDNSLYGPPYPVGYFSGPIFPIIVLARPFWGGVHRPQWPGRPGTGNTPGRYGYLPPTHGSLPPTHGYRPGTSSYVGLPSAIGRPTWSSAPTSPVGIRSGVIAHPVTTYRPPVVSHVPAPVTVHAIGHR